MYGFYELGGVVALVFAMTWNPPTGKVHEFISASDYNPSRESGCTNSGDGCHGFEESHGDFNAHHPETDCGTCHEYQDVGCIPCHSPSQREYEPCHDGSMPGAVDCVRLTDPAPGGHYNEAAHTAVGTDMTQIVRVREGGKAGAVCTDCHSRDLCQSQTGIPEVEGSPYGPDIGCGECHNDERRALQAKWLA
ncbi:MAG: hypothetical protein Q8M66_05155 [Actinomycetota bacterium]|nr:hypothetical protein [Actinomycetota bacterium]MDZ4178884.1 hypothetical protein [Coriobacteriia bacterium]